MKDQHYYICDYCYKEFEPKRRRIQKYCSDTCRSKAYHARKNTKDSSLATVPENKSIQVPDLKKIERMSLAGVGNAAVGNLTSDIIKSLLTPSDNKPATKGDLKILIDKLGMRYHPISNLQQRADGALPYFDLETNEVIYSTMNLR